MDNVNILFQHMTEIFSVFVTVLKYVHKVEWVICSQGFMKIL